jgi:hypothetical protein
LRSSCTQKDEFQHHDAEALGVRHLMWATDNQADLQRVTERLRVYDSAAFSHTIQGITLSQYAFPAFDHNRRPGRTRAGGLRLPGFPLLVALAVKTRAGPLLLTRP